MLEDSVTPAVVVRPLIEGLMQVALADLAYVVLLVAALIVGEVVLLPFGLDVGLEVEQVAAAFEALQLGE